jgi:hypothetical protein
LWPQRRKFDSPTEIVAVAPISNSLPASWIGRLLPMARQQLKHDSLQLKIRFPAPTSLAQHLIAGCDPTLFPQASQTSILNVSFTFLPK